MRTGSHRNIEFQPKDNRDDLETIVYEPLSREDLDNDFMFGVLKLMKKAYKHQFMGGLYQLLPKKEIGYRVTPIDKVYHSGNEASRNRQRRAILSALDAGSEFWIVRTPEEYCIPRPALRAFVKVTPTVVPEAEAQLHPMIEELVVNPNDHLQDKGLGSAGLICALGYSEHKYKEYSKVVAHAIVGNDRVNHWFLRLGLSPLSTAKPLMIPGDPAGRLERERYESGPIRDTAYALAQLRSSLQQRVGFLPEIPHGS